MNEGRPTAAFAFPRARRLQFEAEFTAVARAGPDAIRLGQRWFVLTALPIRTDAPVDNVDESQRIRPRTCPVRFGLTVGKKMARRSVDRVLVKRILREAARHSAPALGAVATTPLDVVLRLKAPLPAPGSMGVTALKRALRADADALLARFHDRLAATAAPQPRS